MSIDAGSFFEEMPQALPLYHAFAERILLEYPNAQVRIQKSQISFFDRHPFAYVWLPIRKMKNRPDVYMILSFGLTRQLDNPRIVEVAEPYPHRFTHHLIIQNQSEIDEKLMNWISEAYYVARSDNHGTVYSEIQRPDRHGTV